MRQDAYELKSANLPQQVTQLVRLKLSQRLQYTLWHLATTLTLYSAACSAIGVVYSGASYSRAFYLSSVRDLVKV